MTNEKRLIDANAFKMFLEDVRQDYLEEDTFSSDFAAKVIETVQDEYLANAPTVDAVEVVHGRWVSLTECANAGVYCSVCNKKVYKEDYAWCNRKNKLRSNYCPNCGAKMDGGTDDV